MRRLLAREPGTLTLQDVGRDGKVLLTRDVQRVAAKYLVDSNLTFVALQPRPLDAPVVPGATK